MKSYKIGYRAKPPGLRFSRIKIRTSHGIIHAMNSLRHALPARQIKVDNIDQIRPDISPKMSKLTLEDENRNALKRPIAAR